MSIYASKKVVAIGGGHGLGRMLAALKDFGSNATGIVTTTDNGGSTGRIRDCQGGIAWGDTRNCINQLITEPSISSMMFEYRFKGSGELNGHNLGNLMLTALDNLSVRPLDAINLIRNMLKVDVNIVPMSEHPSDLKALSADGMWVTGETSVDEMKEDLRRLDLDPEVPATKEGVIAIEQADCIVLGPGSFLTSIMPPLLLPEIGQAIANNLKAKLVFVDNLSPEFGPAARMTLHDRLSWCERACHARKVDVVLVDTPHPELNSDWNCVVTDLASANRDWRHDRTKLQKAIVTLLSN
ncbi:MULTISPECIES: YvcK family protein [unclassified Vibrio]|uniref:YvcK family protein n=1 Tax=unclassified Vibrio TaxID=2614977 RepID=UPI0013619339|nr:MULTISPECIES: YvcK family protein [unclassified Vibrio]NAW56779.1 uridine diphosphate-N-acetylglucosamine-binding protein YvcK [Vibrio sp. V36_P2S2PM302]NAX20592.1 uridine diphosphate-N-acetylglucosamine-binding protein YvcK [Vibrio sp. V39_P1S14PM300]NAX24120.1 uridine diphosphate-N-acetylglucosamine-binding protein YvcK [Vibrio sp. V38_P2S17PM301]NAX28999.1 uridine diphosphate-N-acetylglucosamine-binding protein YvcK [Vibrio sp. V37_P2S8PM304]